MAIKDSGSELSDKQLYRTVNQIARKRFSPVTEFLIAQALEQELLTRKMRLLKQRVERDTKRVGQSAGL